MILDDKIKQIAPELIQKIPYVCYVLDNETFNNNYKDINKVEAISKELHDSLLNILTDITDKYRAR